MLSYSVGYSMTKGHDFGWSVMAFELVGVAGFEPVASSSPSQAHSFSCWAFIGAGLVSRSADVRRSQQDRSVRTFIGVADREEGNAAGADADGDTLQQRAEVVWFGWRCWLAHAREALRGRVLSWVCSGRWPSAAMCIRLSAWRSG